MDQKLREIAAVDDRAREVAWVRAQRQESAMLAAIAPFVGMLMAEYTEGGAV